MYSFQTFIKIITIQKLFFEITVICNLKYQVKKYRHALNDKNI